MLTRIATTSAVAAKAIGAIQFAPDGASNIGFRDSRTRHAGRGRVEPVAVSTVSSRPSGCGDLTESSQGASRRSNLRSVVMPSPLSRVRRAPGPRSRRGVRRRPG